MFLTSVFAKAKREIGFRNCCGLIGVKPGIDTIPLCIMDTISSIFGEIGLGLLNVDLVAQNRVSQASFCNGRTSEKELWARFLSWLCDCWILYCIYVGDTATHIRKFDYYNQVSFHHC